MRGPEPQPWRQRSSVRHIAAALLQARLDFWLCWRSSHEELRYRGRSRPADREEPREAVVRRGHQHHTVEAVSASAACVFSAAPVKVVALRRVDEPPLQDVPPLPAGDGQHDGGTFTSIVRHAVESVTAETPTRERHVRHAREAKPRAAATNTQQSRRSTCGGGQLDSRW